MPYQLRLLEILNHLHYSLNQTGSKYLQKEQRLCILGGHKLNLSLQYRDTPSLGRCSQEVRAFFKTVINPKFHFSTYIQNYIQNKKGKTYHDVVNAWYEEEERTKTPLTKKQIGSQFEYNQFTRDYFHGSQKTRVKIEKMQSKLGIQ